MFAFLVFAFTLFGILWRPFGFKIWVYSSFGAFIILAFKLLDLHQVGVIFWLVWDSCLLLLCLIVISFCLEALGFFEWLIFYTLKFCAKSPINSATNEININAVRLFVILCTLCAVISGILANDGAILIFTPLILGVFLRAKNADKRLVIAFLFAVGFICDTSSNALLISNLTNVITANFHHLAFNDFAKTMFLPNLLAFLCALMLFLLVFRKALFSTISFRTPSKPKLEGKFFIFYLVLLGVFVLSFFISSRFNVPLSLNCLVFALFLLVILWGKSRTKALKTLKVAPFGIIIFVFTLFIVVQSLHKIDIQSSVNSVFNALCQSQISSIFGTGLISAFLSSIFNNLPATLFTNSLISDFFANEASSKLLHLKQSFIYANLLGANIGSKLTPIGSLCTLLWLSLLAKRGLKMSFKKYLSLSLIFTLPVLLCALFALCLIQA